MLKLTKLLHKCVLNQDLIISIFCVFVHEEKREHTKQAPNSDTNNTTLEQIDKFFIQNWY